MNKELLQKYADFAVEIGVGLQPEQTLIITSSVETTEFARMCAAAAFRVGARDVVVKYGDDKLARIRFEHASEDALCDVKAHVVRSYLDYVESEGGAAVLHILAENPEAFSGLDAAKVDKANTARRSALKEWRDYTMNDRVAWCIVAVPGEEWAAKIFPGDADAVEKLWQAIFDVCRVTGGDPVGAWKAHVEKMTAYRDRLNELDLESVHMKSANGTDLTVGLADDAVWEGARSHTPAGQGFIANIPTEEVFTAPHKDKVEGIVYATKPYVYHGDLIEGLWVRFEKGRVVEYGADKNEALLKMLLDTDEGSRSIGELALVPKSSPINQSGLLFYNTLFDENAACHIAFGDGYPGTVKGGTGMTPEELLAHGVNHSLIHEDVMVGAQDMRITGKTRDGREVAIFEDGDWAL